MRIGELARHSGVRIDTIRYYERLGLLPQPLREASGYRCYRPSDLQRLKFIRRAKALGFDLDTIGELLAISAGCGDMASLRERSARTLTQIEHRISELSRVRDALSALVNASPGHGALADCPILSALQEDRHEPALLPPALSRRIHDRIRARIAQRVAQRIACRMFHGTGRSRPRSPLGLLPRLPHRPCRHTCR